MPFRSCPVMLLPVLISALMTAIPGHADSSESDGAADRQTIRDALTFHAAFDTTADATHFQRDGTIYTAESTGRESIKPGIHVPGVRLVEGDGKYGGHLRFTEKTKSVLAFAGSEMPYAERDWSGSVSMWLRLDPDEDLEPGFCDPFQVTQKAWNDAAFFVDFDKELPRDFRLGAFSDLGHWNPDGVAWSEFPESERPTVTATDPPFAGDRWTHVAFTFENVNPSEGKTSVATLYLNGEPVGSLQEPLRFRWDPDQVAIMIGINYIGDLDDLMIFSRALRPAEVAFVHASPSPIGFPRVADIGTRRELFVDRYLIEELSGEAKQVVQQPEPREVVLVTDAPWEGNTSAYYTIFEDESDDGGYRFRMYYRGSHYDTEKKKGTHREVVCYAESHDGIHWRKPELGLVEFDGSTANNIVWDGIGSHCFTPFLDTHPDCPPESRYKALGRGRPLAKKGLYAFRSADGIRWEPMSDEPVIVDGAFDSQNLAFYDPTIEKYRAYHRDFRGVRDIKWQVSDDFLNWTQPEFLDYGDTPLEHLYTNAIRPEPNAPHLLIGFPTRYLPDDGSRVEPTFMSSRDGRRFHRWLEPVIPESAPHDRSGNRSNYMAHGLLTLPDRPDELSVYATEAYYTGPDSRLRRFRYRVDGYVAVESSGEGQLETRPLRFDGDSMTINAKVSDGGSVVVEMMAANGTTIRSEPFVGDEIDATVNWESGDLAAVAGQPVRLRFRIRDASLFAFQFHP